LAKHRSDAVVELVAGDDLVVDDYRDAVERRVGREAGCGSGYCQPKNDDA
jgi:hypothetical protein